MDKAEALRERGVAIVERYGVPTIADELASRSKIASLETAGDHHLALCDVLAYENIEGEGEPLYTKDLPK